MGGENYADLTRTLLATYASDLTFEFMSTKAKESRRLRRQTQLMDDSHRASSGMDLLGFQPATWRQEEMWSLIDTNTITIAHGSAGTGKTLVALWKGLTGVKEGRYDQVYYIRSDVGVEFQRGRGTRVWPRW